VQQQRGTTTDVIGIVALVLGIFSLPTNCCCSPVGIVFGIAAAILGFMSMARVRARPDLGGAGLGLAGAICGIIGFIVGVILLILGAGMQILQHLDQFR
jgi:FtsH-binding integral membrane protein